MNELSVLLATQPWLTTLASIGVALLLQTSLLLAPGIWGLHALQKRKSGACTLLGRLLLFATLSLVALSGGLVLNHYDRVPAVWNVGLPLPAQQRPMVADNASRVALPDSSPRSQTFLEAERVKRTQIGETNPATLPVGKTSSSLQSTPVEQASPSKAPQPALNSSVAPSQKDRGNVWVGLVALLWLSGALLQLLWLGVCHGVLWRLRRGATPMMDARMLASLKWVCTTLEVRDPSLLSHNRVSSPFLTGLLRPAIVLPASAVALPEAALEAVLFHEASHLKRRDLWWNTLGRVLCALLWPQPLLWMLCRQLEQINEEACDSAVLRSGCSPKDYAQYLIDWAQSRMPRRIERVAGAGVMTGCSSLSRRVQSILSDSAPPNTPLSRRARWTMFAGAVAAVVAMPLLVASNPLEPGLRKSGTRAPQKPNKGTAPNPSDSTKQALQHFKESDGYRLYIEGVSGGVLQGISLMQQGKEDDVTAFYLAPTLRRQTGKGGFSNWLMSGGISYTFKPDVGLVSEARFGKMSLTFHNHPAIEEFLIQQTQAAPAPFSTSQWQQTQSRSAPPMEQIKALEAWAKENGNAALTGRVLDEDGQPVEGAKVEVHISEQTLQGITHAPKKEGFGRIYGYLFALSKATRNLLNQSATTKSDGTYRIEGLGAAPYRLGMSSYGRMARFNYDVPPPAQVLTASHQVVPRANQTTIAPDLVLTGGGLIHVRVEDKDSGHVLSDVSVSASSKKGSPPYDYGHFFSVDTDSAGESLFRLPAGEGSVAIGEEYQPELHGFATPSKGGLYKRNNLAEVAVDGGPVQLFAGAVKVQISPNQTREVVIRLQRFVAPTPTPIPRLVPPPAGKGTLLGRVVNEAGEGVGGIPVFARMQQGAQWHLMQGAGLAYSNSATPNFDRKWASIQGVLSQSTTTLADGSFRFDGLTTAPYNLVIATDNESFGLKPPAGWVAAAVEGTWAKEGQVTRRAKPIVLTHGGLIEGRILDKATGLPLGGVSIGSNGPQLPLSTDHVMSATSDSLGKFTLRVAPGTTSLYIAGPWNNNSAVYADDGKSADNVARIVTSRGLFAGSGNVPFEIDRGTPQVGLNMKGRGEGRIEIKVLSGQTRRLTLHLRRLKPAPKSQSKFQ